MRSPARRRLRRPLVLEGLESRRLPATFTVVNTADSGPGSLRAAIESANRAAEASRVAFAIPASDPGFADVDSQLPGGDAAPDAFFIRPLSPLPAVANARGFPVTIDATTQTAFGGDANPFGPEVVLDGTMAGSRTLALPPPIALAQVGVELARDAAGNFVVVWTETLAVGDETTVDEDVYARLFYADGTPRGPAFRVNQGTRSSQGGASVAMDASGGFIVAWGTLELQADPPDPSLRYGTGVSARRFDASGAPLGGEFVVANRASMTFAETPYEMLPSVAIGRDSDEILYQTSALTAGAFRWNVGPFERNGSVDGWNSQSSTRTWTHGSASDPLDPDGTMMGTAGVDPDVAALPDGRFVAVWTVVDGGAEDTRSDDRWTVLAQILGPDGRAQGGPLRLSASGRQQLFPSVAAEDGGFVATWWQPDGIYAQRFDLSGGARGGIFRVGDAGPTEDLSPPHLLLPFPRFGPSITGTPGGGFEVAWDAGPDDSTRIFLRRYDASGAPIGPAAVVSAATSKPRTYATALALAPGRTVVGWHEPVSPADPRRILSVMIVQPGDANGLVLAGDSNVVRGLAVAGFGGAGIYVTGRGNVVAGNYLGVDATGRRAAGNLQGVAATGTSNRIGGATAADRNVISGNRGDGVLIAAGAAGNAVQGNYIGTDAAGMAALGNGQRGVDLWDRAADNVVGGVAPGERNVISANGLEGIAVHGAGSDRNAILGNFIGTDAAGMAALGNAYGGVMIANRAANNVVGGFGVGNVISGNRGNGLAFLDDATGNAAAANVIGLAADGSAALGNAGAGVYVTAPSNTIGGATAADRNVVSGNRGDGVQVRGAAAAFINIAGNFIGTDAAGTLARGNAGYGVAVWDGPSRVAISGNVISANLYGLGILGPGTNRVQVGGNTIGLAADGAAPLGNARVGIGLWGGVSNNTIGGATAADRNVISGNGGDGISLTDAGTAGNRILGNFIGTDRAGSLAVANAGAGVAIAAGASYNTVGAGNVISGNRGAGVSVDGAATRGNAIRGNLIGTDAAGAADLGNYAYGVLVRGAPATAVGGAGAGEGNVISGNGGATTLPDGATVVVSGFGVWVDGPGATGAVIQGNRIGTDAAGMVALSATATGVYVGSGGAAIGGPQPGAGNLISGNSIGVQLGGGGNVVEGNSIGVDASGDGPLGNATGILILGGSGNRIGGPGAAANVIARNGGAGVVVLGPFGAIPGSVGNEIRYNAIYANGAAGIDLSAGPFRDGPTPNDPLDVDEGGNRLQNHPDLARATPGASARVAGRLAGAPSATYTIDFYAGEAAGDARRHLGAIVVVSGADGTVEFDALLGPAAAGEFLVATATDAAGNTSEYSAAVAARPTAARLLAVEPVAPDVRNRAVGSVVLAFSEPIDAGTFDAGDVLLLRDGAPIAPGAGLALTALGDGRYRLDGLAGATALDGRYVLSVAGAGLADAWGEPAVGSAEASWLMDATAPAATVLALARRQSSAAFEVAVSASDPGGAASGLLRTDVYVAVEGGPFGLWRSFGPGEATATFVGESNRTYAFRSLAVDRAGNVEVRGASSIEAYTYVPDVAPPVTGLRAVDAATPTFRLEVAGTDAGDSLLKAFEIYAAVDGGPLVLLATLAAGAPAGGSYSRTFEFQATADGAEHSYRFVAVGVDGAGNREATTAGIMLVRRFETPAALGLSGFDVQKGMVQRSYIRHLDLTFNRPGSDLDAILAGLADADPSNDRIRLTRRGLDGSGGSTITLGGLVSASGRTLAIDFGPNGLGGAPGTTAGDGYYTLELDLDGDGTFETTRRFYRLLGDVDGSRAVDAADTAAVLAAMGTGGAGVEADVNGDGVVNALDSVLATRSRGRRLADWLEIDG